MVDMLYVWQYDNSRNNLLYGKAFIFSVEIATLTRENGKTNIKILEGKEVDKLIKLHEEEEKKAEAEKNKEKS